MSEPAKAVFLSYASPSFAKVYPPMAAPKATRATEGRQDAEAAKRIADALRAAGVEVWFHQSELVGGGRGVPRSGPGPLDRDFLAA